MKKHKHTENCQFCEETHLQQPPEYFVMKQYPIEGGWGKSGATDEETKAFCIEKLGGTPTLRDIFAAHVVIASLIHEKNMVCLGAHLEDSIKSIAEDCYKMADALLKARVK